jgi:hypothetical protein
VDFGVDWSHYCGSFFVEAIESGIFKATNDSLLSVDSEQRKDNSGKNERISKSGKLATRRRR